MLYRLAIAAALGLAALTAPADAQVAQVLPSCGSASIPVGPGGRLYTDQTGNLCTIAGGSVTPAGTSGTQAQSVQGISGGVPQAVAEQGSSLAAVGIVPAITQAGTAVVGKASQGNLYSAYAVNTTATAGYLACINATAAPAAGAAITPVDVQTLAGAVGATASINYTGGPPNGYSTGIVCLVTTSLSTYTAGGASFIQARVR